MTAMNLIVQRRANAAFLLTDTAVYRPDGTVDAFRSKVIDVHLPDGSHVAIAASGMTSRRPLTEHLRDLRASTLDGFLRAFKARFPDIVGELLASGADAGGDNTLSLVMACFDASSGRPGGYAISNANACFSREHYRPWELKPLKKHFTGYLGDPFPEITEPGLALRFNPCSPEHWKPDRDGLTLLEAQRAHLFGQLGEEYCGVGGEGVLTRVDRRGITHVTLCAWPDRVRRKIDRNATEWLVITRLRAWARQKRRPATRVDIQLAMS